MGVCLDVCVVSVLASAQVNEQVQALVPEFCPAYIAESQGGYELQQFQIVAEQGFLIGKTVLLCYAAAAAVIEITALFGVGYGTALTDYLRADGGVLKILVSGNRMPSKRVARYILFQA